MNLRYLRDPAALAKHYFAKVGAKEGKGPGQLLRGVNVKGSRRLPDILAAPNPKITR
jgi:hypothetical protein